MGLLVRAYLACAPIVWFCMFIGQGGIPGVTLGSALPRRYVGGGGGLDCEDTAA
jgi:hypothetical protein